MIEDQASAEFVAECRTAVAAAGLNCFQCLVRRMSGCYPTTLFEVCQQMGIVLQTCEWHSLDRGWDVPLASLPVPHVIDGDWRYSRPTASKLLDLTVRNVGTHATCVHIGSPSTYRAALNAFPEARNHHLHDRNALMHDPRAQLLGEGTETADAAILDPPWYPQDTLLFLSVAARTLRPDALVLLAQPGRLTRPGVTVERAQLLAGASEQGYEIVHTLHDYVRYETPHFEFVTLRRTLDVRVPADWRTGDLLLLRYGVDESPKRVAPVVEQHLDERWEEVSLGPVRYKYRSTNSRDTLRCLTADGVARTVSRRDPLRASVGVWSTGNRVYSCDDSRKFLRIVRQLNHHLVRSEFSEGTVEAVLVANGISETHAADSARSLVEDVMEHLQHA